MSAMTVTRVRGVPTKPGHHEAHGPKSRVSPNGRDHDLSLHIATQSLVVLICDVHPQPVHVLRDLATDSATVRVRQAVTIQVGTEVLGVPSTVPSATGTDGHPCLMSPLRLQTVGSVPALLCGEPLGFLLLDYPACLGLRVHVYTGFHKQVPLVLVLDVKPDGCRPRLRQRDVGRPSVEEGQRIEARRVASRVLQHSISDHQTLLGGHLSDELPLGVV